MIRGLTHNEDGILHHSTRYKGKISTGYAPGEPPNTTNHPVAAGFFRILKEVTETQKIGATQKEVVIKKWVNNIPVQKALQEQNKKSSTPRLLEFVSLFHSPRDFWESSLAMFSSSDGLLCRSEGEGTPAKYLTFGNDNERIWVDRQFDGVPGCTYRNCPDFCSGKCKPLGLMKIFPTCDLSTMPYRFETRSINTIVGIESSLQDLWTLLNAAHRIRQMEAAKESPPGTIFKGLTFDGFFGAKLLLVHRKIKSGGREVFVTDLFPTADFNMTVMEPIKRGLEQKKNHALLVGAAGSVSLLEQAASNLIAAPVQSSEESIPMDISEERDIAVNFGADAEEIPVVDLSGEGMEPNSGAEKLMEEGPSK